MRRHRPPPDCRQQQVHAESRPQVLHERLQGGLCLGARLRHDSLETQVSRRGGRLASPAGYNLRAGPLHPPAAPRRPQTVRFRRQFMRPGLPHLRAPRAALHQLGGQRQPPQGGERHPDRRAEEGRGRGRPTQEVERGPLMNELNLVRIAMLAGSSRKLDLSQFKREFDSAFHLISSLRRRSSINSPVRREVKLVELRKRLSDKKIDNSAAREQKRAQSYYPRKKSRLFDIKEIPEVEGPAAEPKPAQQRRSM